MGAVYDWVKGILYYMIFLSVTERLLADSHYARHMHFFAGLVLILLVAAPITDVFGLSSQIRTLFQSISLEQDAGDLKKELLGMEQRRTEQIFSQYEIQTAEEVKKMALDQGVSCQSVRVELEREPEQEDFGRVKEISLILEEERKGQVQAEKQTDAVYAKTRRVERVSVDIWEAQSAHIQTLEEEKDVCGELRGKVADYYGLEEDQVKVQRGDD